MTTELFCGCETDVCGRAAANTAVGCIIAVVPFTDDDVTVCDHVPTTPTVCGVGAIGKTLGLFDVGLTDPRLMPAGADCTAEYTHNQYVFVTRQELFV